MNGRKRTLVFLPLAVALLGSVVYSTAESPGGWVGLLPCFYCIAIVAAGAGFGLWPAVLVAVVSGAASGAATVLGRADPIVWAALQTALFVFLGVTAAQVGSWAGSPVVAPACKPEASPDDFGALRRVVVGIVRQFRTPVTAIEGAGWVLQDSSLPDEKRQEFVGIVRREAHRLSRVLCEALNFTQPHRPRFQSVNLRTLVDEVIQLAGAQDRASSLQYRTDIPPDLPLIRCDPELIRQALMNLVTNSIQASPGGGRIEISARILEDTVAIRVCDEGRGISPAIIDRIFEPFFTTNENSSGLGLAVVLQIVKAHGGSIHVQPLPQAGACFVVHLPASAPAPAAPPGLGTS